MTKHDLLFSDSADTRIAVPRWLPLFSQDTRSESVTFSAQPDIAFKPKGLMLWDLPPDAMLDCCRMANQETVLAGHGPLPAKVFARAESYEKLKARVENGEEFFSEWIQSVPCYPYNRLYVQLRTTHPYGFVNTQVAFWGIGFMP